MPSNAFFHSTVLLSFGLLDSRSAVHSKRQTQINYEFALVATAVGNDVYIVSFPCPHLSPSNAVKSSQNQIQHVYLNGLILTTKYGLSVEIKLLKTIVHFVCERDFSRRLYLFSLSSFRFVITRQSRWLLRRNPAKLWHKKTYILTNSLEVWLTDWAQTIHIFPSDVLMFDLVC